MIDPLRNSDHMYSTAVFVAAWVMPESHYRLSTAISAFEIAYGEDEVEKLGMICRLREAANLEVCGEGFNDRTLKVRCGERYYFVFLQDLDLQQSWPVNEPYRISAKADE